jgi:predicted nucleotidyltransferase
MLHNYRIELKEIPPLAQTIGEHFSSLPQVVAVVLAGSRTTTVTDESSDFDFYVYVKEEIPVDIREAIARKFSDRIAINNQFWEPGDEWIDINTGCGIDIMYRQPEWIEEELDRVLVKYQASVGYSTCFWWNVLTSVSLYDRDGWFQQLQANVDQPYPEQLRQAIIAKNYPILRHQIFSFRHQLESAVLRRDSVSIIHRTAAFLG